MYRILFNTIYLGSPQKKSAVRLFQNNNIPLSRFLLYWSRPLRFGALGEICAYSFVRKWPVVQVAVVKRTGNNLPFIALMSYSTGLCRGWAAKILLAMTAGPFFRSIWAAFDFCRERFLRDLDSASEPVPTFWGGRRSQLRLWRRLRSNPTGARSSNNIPNRRRM